MTTVLDNLTLTFIFYLVASKFSIVIPSMLCQNNNIFYPKNIQLCHRCWRFFNIVFSQLYVEEHDNVSILYADVVNYTMISTTLSPSRMVELLNELFTRFDEASEVSLKMLVVICDRFLVIIIYVQVSMKLHNATFFASCNWQPCFYVC